MSLATHFLQLGPISKSAYHLPLKTSNYEADSGLIHGLGQSPHDQITPQSVDPPMGDQTFDTRPFFLGGVLHSQTILDINVP
jgi:hypothetical protein